MSKSSPPRSPKSSSSARRRASSPLTHRTHQGYAKLPEYQELVRFLKEEDDFVIGSHEQPDGDALGSSFALWRVLTSMGKKARVLYPLETISASYRFLAEDYPFPCKADRLKTALNAVVLECPSLSRLGKEGATTAGKATRIANIDHHQQNDVFGAINLILADAPSTTEILYRVFLDMGVDIDKQTATCLYAGLVSDTGRFQYTSTTGDTLRVAAELVDLGVEPNRIFQHIYEQSALPTLRLLARMLGRIQMKDGVTWSVVRRADLKATGANLLETEDFVDHIRGVVGTEVAILFKETGNGFRVSLRSRSDLDVSLFAQRFGGGGHKKASGCKTLWTPARVVTAVRKYMATGELPPFTEAPKPEG